MIHELEKIVKPKFRKDGKIYLAFPFKSAHEVAIGPNETTRVVIGDWEVFEEGDEFPLVISRYTLERDYEPINAWAHSALRYADRLEILQGYPACLD